MNDALVLLNDSLVLITIFLLCSLGKTQISVRLEKCRFFMMTFFILFQITIRVQVLSITVDYVVLIQGCT